MAPVRERILITVKTYPTLSTRYGETVCTAGVRADGTWIRLYPVPFRRLDESQQYRKFDWVSCRTARQKSDVRPESHRPLEARELVAVDHIGTENGWRERRRIILQPGRVEHSFQRLIEDAHANVRSLATFKPSRLIDLIVEEEEERDWSVDRVQQMRELSRQSELFDADGWRETFKLIPKLPYRFSYRFTDEEEKERTLVILDWEIGALYWNCVRSEANEPRAIQKVREMYVDRFFRTDLHFFLGTTQQWHQVAPNPWVVIGVFPAPHVTQLELI